MSCLPAHLQIPQDLRFVKPSKAFVRSYGDALRLPSEKVRRLEQFTETILNLIITNSRSTSREVPIELELRTDGASLSLKFLNRGLPIFERDLRSTDVAIDSEDTFEFVNLGPQGQAFVSVLPIDPTEHPDLEAPLPETNPEEIEVRLMGVLEVDELAKLFFRVYGYRYINDWVYFPEKIRRKLEAQDMISLVASSPAGRHVGHVALVRFNTSPVVYDLGLGVVDPGLKSKGLFKRLLSESMDLISRTPMDYCIFDMVTNHLISQREVFNYPACVMCLNVGVQGSTTQASLKKLGIGTDAEDMDRYSILMAVRLGVPHPFGETVTLPPNLGEALDFLLTPLGVRWVPSSRFSSIPRTGSYQTKLDSIQKSVFFDLEAPGLDAVTSLIDDWKYYIRLGNLYGAVDVPLDQPGLGSAYERLCRAGFFLAGLIPYRHTGRLALRLQCLGPTRVSWENIKIHGAQANQLLQLVRSDHERNSLI